MPSTQPYMLMRFLLSFMEIYYFYFPGDSLVLGRFLILMFGENKNVPEYQKYFIKYMISSKLIF